MDIASAQQTLLRTHIVALKQGRRPNGVYLESGPGVGKSDGTRQLVGMLARDLNEPVGLVTEMLATYSSVDVRGFMLPAKTDIGWNTVWSRPSWYPKKGNVEVALPDGTWLALTEVESVPRVGILFLDEFAQAEDEVKKPAAELIYKGRVGTTELPNGWRVIAAGNRTSDRSGVMRELMFIVNRRCKLKIDARMPAWLDWANAQPPEHRPHFLTMSFAQKNPDLVFRDTVPEGTDPFCTPRTLCLADEDLRALRSEDDIKRDTLPVTSIAREVAAGWLGDGTAAQFFTHIKYVDKLPDIEDIEKDPMKAKCDDGRDVQMVCAYMLAHHVTEKNAENILKYLGRMNIEMQVLCIRAISAQQDRAKAIVIQPGYMQWLMKNKELLRASQS